MPVAPPAPSGVGWLRAAVVRFSEGDAHRRRRALVVDVIDRLGRVTDQGTPTRSLLAALGLPLELDAEVAAVAASYQPHLPQTEEADRAADRLVAACGGRTEEAAAIVCVLVQAHAAMLALLDERRRIVRRARAVHPPCRTERRGSAGRPRRRSLRPWPAPVPRRATRPAPRRSGTGADVPGSRR